MSRLISLLSHWQILIALSGVALFCVSAEVHQIEVSVATALLVFFGLMWVYLLDASAHKSPEDRVNQPERFFLLRKYQSWVVLVKFLCLVMGALAALELGLSIGAWLFLGACAFLAWAYSFGWGSKRLKNLVWSKTWLVSLGWGFGVALGLVFLESLVWSDLNWSYFLVIVSLLYFDTYVLDWRDRAGDRLAGVKSDCVFREKPGWTNLVAPSMFWCLGVGLSFSQSNLGALKAEAVLTGSFIFCLLGLKLSFKFMGSSFWMALWRIMAAVVLAKGV